MELMKKKIQSRRGASLTFALLLFLVCAVVGSVVLAAGTAASGRMSQIAEMDQRYYSVNSAARLLIDKIDGEEITIIETKPLSGNANYIFGDGTEIIDGSVFDSVAKEAAVYYFKNNNTPQRKKSSDETDNTLLLSLWIPEKDTLKVNITEEIDGTLRDLSSGTFKNEKGTLILTVEYAGKASEKKSYAMKLFFNADEKHFAEQMKDASGNITATKTTFKIKWQIQDIQVVGANRWE